MPLACDVEARRWPIEDGHVRRVGAVSGFAWPDRPPAHSAPFAGRLYGSAFGWQKCAGRKWRKDASYDLRAVRDGRAERRRNDGRLGGSRGWSGLVKHVRAFGIGHPRQWRLWTASASRPARALPPQLTLLRAKSKRLLAVGSSPAAGLTAPRNGGRQRDNSRLTRSARASNSYRLRRSAGQRERNEPVCRNRA
jgi:hypothetical protein